MSDGLLAYGSERWKADDAISRTHPDREATGFHQGLIVDFALVIIPHQEYNRAMSWEVEYTDECGDWWHDLSTAQQDAVVVRVGLLVEHGPDLPYPYSSSVRSSRHGNMRELRIQRGGKPLRVFYAFDPRRLAILLIGGDKTGQERFYEVYVPIADALYDTHPEELRREGLIE